MADETPAAPPAGAPAPGASGQPMLNQVGMYMRDLSFENPGGPQSLLSGGGAPKFNVSINVGVKKQTDDLYAVELTFQAKTERDNAVLFNIELIYGGIFRLRNIAEKDMAPALMIECPRLIFPFARQVLANVTQAGGFPPLLMDPVDFVQIYRQNLANIAAQQKASGAPVDAKPN